MSGRLIDFLVLLIALFGIFVAQFATAMIMDPFRDEMLEEDIDPKYNIEQEMDQTFEVLTVWVPTIASLGMILLVAFREYRRQRIAGRGGL